jgi:beta-aspartyl-peptidase (threonine type)
MTQQKFSPVLLVHGGAWAIPDDMVEAHLGGVRAAMATGWKLLADGKTALDAVEAAVAAMEDDETFDAGRGSFLTSDGGVQLDALMMDGKTLRAGGVGCVEHIRNPIRLAHKVLTESPHVYLVAEGAERFASEHDIALCENSELIIPREVERLRRFQAAGQPDSTFAGAAAEASGTSSHDTVGAVALDADGNLAAATSTGGTLNKTPGRVGDSSLIGCGCYADNMKAAVSCTGWGEPIMKLVLGKWACDRVEEGEAPDVVARRAIAYLKDRANGHGGMILLDQKGRIGAFHSTPRMAWGLKSKQHEHAQVEGDPSPYVR